VSKFIVLRTVHQRCLIEADTSEEAIAIAKENQFETTDIVHLMAVDALAAGFNAT
jgi:hypothetical protein